MKLRLLILSLATAVALQAADAVPLFNGVLSTGKEHRFVLVSQAGKVSPFLRLGESFEGYAIKAYDPKESALDLERDGKITRITLVGDAAIGKAPAIAPATISDAEELFRVMRFDEMMGKILEGQKKALAGAMQQSTAQGLARQGINLTPEDAASLAAMQSKVMDETLGVIVGPEMRGAMARIYSEVFTKEELGGQAAFYATPAGQALTDKQPAVQEKMMAVMMPLMIQSQQAAAAKMRDLTAGLRAKYGPGGPAAAPGGAPAPAPAPKQ